MMHNFKENRKETYQERLQDIVKVEIIGGHGVDDAPRNTAQGSLRVHVTSTTPLYPSTSATPLHHPPTL